MNNTSKILRMSKSLKWVALGIMIVLPILDAGYWILGGYPTPFFQIDFLPLLGEAVVPPLKELAPVVKFYAFLTTLLPVGIALIAINALRKLFAYYEKIEIFSEKCVGCIRTFGWMLLIGQFTYPLYCAMISTVLTFNNPPGQRMIVASFGLTQIALAITASSILLISWIMEEGKKLQEEQEATI